MVKWTTTIGTRRMDIITQNIDSSQFASTLATEHSVTIRQVQERTMSLHGLAMADCKFPL